MRVVSNIAWCILACALFVAVGFLGPGCAHKSAPVVEKPIERAITTPATKQADAAPTTTPVAEEVPAPTRRCSLSPLHFGFDSYIVTEADRPLIESNANCVKRNASGVIVEGHADERGTEEYNMALSDMRARSVAASLKMYLPKRKITTVGYGESRPLCNDHNETCWQQNRRAEIR
jgi:peptidoglycan-associated lipoprotein